LRGCGYDGSYDAVRRYARRCGRGMCAAEFCTRGSAPVRLSHEIVLLNGVTVTVKVAHVRLCHNRMLFARA
jgi:hypothetical protein